MLSTECRLFRCSLTAGSRLHRCDHSPDLANGRSFLPNINCDPMLNAVQVRLQSRKSGSPRIVSCNISQRPQHSVRFRTNFRSNGTMPSSKIISLYALAMLTWPYEPTSSSSLALPFTCLDKSGRSRRSQVILLLAYPTWQSPQTPCDGGMWLGTHSMYCVITRFKLRWAILNAGVLIAPSSCVSRCSYVHFLATDSRGPMDYQQTGGPTPRPRTPRRLAVMADVVV